MKSVNAGVDPDNFSVQYVVSEYVLTCLTRLMRREMLVWNAHQWIIENAELFDAMWAPDEGQTAEQAYEANCAIVSGLQCFECVHLLY